MSNIKETSDEMISLKVRTFIGMLISVITVTNSFTVIYNKIDRNQEQITYERDRADKITKRKAQEAKDYYLVQELKKELQECKNK